MLHLEGMNEIRAPKEKVWRVLVDTSTIQSCIPGLDTVESSDATSIRCKIKMGFSFLRGTMNLEVKFHDLQPPSSARMIGHASGVGTRLDLESTIQLDGKGDVTLVSWKADAKLGGLAATLSRGLMEGTVKQMVAEMFECVKGLVERGGRA